MLEDLGMDDDVSNLVIFMPILMDSAVVLDVTTVFIGRGSCPSAKCECCHPKESDHLGHLPQGAKSLGEFWFFLMMVISQWNISAGWSSPTWGWWEQGEEDRWHLHLGRWLPQGLLLWFLSISSFLESFRRSDSWKLSLKRHCSWWMCEQPKLYVSFHCCAGWPRNSLWAYSGCQLPWHQGTSPTIL